MSDNPRELFFLMVDQTTVHPLVAWARDEIVNLENALRELQKARPVKEKKAKEPGGDVPPTKPGGTDTPA